MSSLCAARVALAALVLAVAAGCDDPLKEVERIESVRVLGARVEVQGDAERAAPAPGERASVRWLVVAPTEPVALGWSLGVCLARENNLGLSSCAEPPFAQLEQTEPSVDAPTIEFAVPASIDPQATPRLALLGVICPDGSPEGSLDEARCTGEDPGTAVSLELELARPGDVNANPGFAEPALALDGEEWPDVLVTSAPCAGEGLLEIAAGSPRHLVRVDVRQDARDPLPQVIEDDPLREELRISHFSTDGGFTRAFSALAADDPGSSVQVPWDAPATAPEGGQLARFWFVLRDLRGGSSFVSRALCVVP
ncbi:MAG: hypothetical protein ABW217_16685 [Polyangiaceae bacterium]